MEFSKWQSKNSATHSVNTQFILMPQHLISSILLLTTTIYLVFSIFRYHGLVLGLGI